MKSVLLAASLSPTLIMAQTTVWTIKVQALVTNAAITQNGALSTQIPLIQNQLNTLETRLNQTSTGPLFDLVLDNSAVIADQNAATSVALANDQLRLIYDANSSATATSWQASTHSIVFNWGSTNFGGPFGSTATDLLTKMIGQSHGTFDLTQLQVSSGSNPISGTAYPQTNDWCSNPFGASSWGTHGANMIKAIGGNLLHNTAYDQIISSHIPSNLSIKVKDRDGKVVPSANVKLYPSTWASNAVNANAAYSYTSNTSGIATLNTDLFGKNQAGSNYWIARPLYLAEATLGSKKAYAWYSVTDAMNSSFAGNSSYEASIQLDTSITVAKSLGSNNTSTNVFIPAGGYTSLIIDQYPTWTFSSVTIALNPINQAYVNLTVMVNGQNYGTYSGWYNTISVPVPVSQSREALNIQIYSATNQNVAVQWWATN